MKIQGLFIVFILLFSTQISFQQGSSETEEPVIEDEDLILLFSISIAVVVGIILFLSRDYILRRQGDYERKNFESKKNRDYEKYHSDWTSDDVDFGNQHKKNKSDEEFRKALKNSSLPDYYEILGITRDSSQVEIKNRFRMLVKEWHPDKTKDPDTEKKMAEINQAYEVLSNPEKKSQYDKYFQTK